MVRNYRKAMTFITSTWASGEHGPLAACVPAGMVSARERLALNRCSDRLFAVYIYIYIQTCLIVFMHIRMGRSAGWARPRPRVCARVCINVYIYIYIYKSASRNLDNKIMCYWH
jgi:hypothetical protein